MKNYIHYNNELERLITIHRVKKVDSEGFEYKAYGGRYGIEYQISHILDTVFSDIDNHFEQIGTDVIFIDAKFMLYTRHGCEWYELPNQKYGREVDGIYKYEIISYKLCEWYYIGRNIAIELHGNQKYGTKPYIYHLEGVVFNLTKYGFVEPIVILLALFHDVLEDVEEITVIDFISKLEVLNVYFEGKLNIYKLAYLCELLKDEDAETRKESKQKTYPKIRRHIFAIIVKVFDRRFNVNESLKSSNLKKLEMYQCEKDEFNSQLINNIPPNSYRQDDELELKYYRYFTSVDLRMIMFN